MKKVWIIGLMTALLFLGVITPASAETVEESLRKDFPRLKFDSVSPMTVKGMYEVVAGTRIIYYLQETNSLIFGEMIDKNGRNLTAARIESVAGERAKTLPLDQAVKVGNGSSTVIEFTDPDCPYCRKASEFFHKRTDATRYVFFLPLSMHKDAENKVRYIFCAPDQAKAYEDAMSGKLDDQKYEVCKKPEVDAAVTLHKSLAEKMGVTGTPFFIVNGTVISGADTARIDQALKKK